MFSRGGKSERREEKTREEVAELCFVQCFVAPDGRRVGSLKRRVHAEPFGEMRDEKSARCCGAKHISKSKCQKHLKLGALLEVEMFKKCAPVWCEAHVEVKSRKNWRSRTTFGCSDVEKVHLAVVRSTFASQKC